MRVLLTLLLGIVLNHCVGQTLYTNVQEGTAYINHVVKKGEGAYGISRAYGATYEDLLKLNNIQKDVILKEGMTLKIPLNGIIKQNCKGDSCVPVYYKVQQSEGLYRIGKNHGDIKAAAIKQLNRLNSETVSLGQELLMGYITVSKNNLSLNEQPVLQQTAVPAVMEKAPVADSQTAEIKVEKGAEPVHSKPAAVKKIIGDTLALLYKGRGFFEPGYKEGSNIKMIRCATFKSESGWSDGKFYALVDGMETGSIFKVTNPENGKVIFVKILGPLPHVKNADSVLMRISSSGMMALGFVYDEQYDVEINY